MGDEALEARLERAHTVIGDLLTSLGEIQLLPERQRTAACEAIAFREVHRSGVHRVAAGIDTSVDRLDDAARATGMPNDLPEDIKRQVLKDGWALVVRRLLERVSQVAAPPALEINRLTAELVQSEERRISAEQAALEAERHNHQMAAELADVDKARADAMVHNEKMHELVATALDYSGWERAGWKDLIAAVARDHHDLLAVRAALPPGDEQVPVAQRVTQLAREHKEMLAEMMKGADPDDLADAASILTEPQPKPATELGLVEFIDVVFDGPPGPTSSFVEVEDHRGHAIKVGEWIDRGDGMWALRIPMQPPAEVGEVMAAAGALSALTAVIATSGLDWRRSPCLAWVYGVLAGHQRDALEDLQMVFGWPDGTVDEIDRHRRALLAARGG